MTPARLRENLAATDLTLTDADMDQIAALDRGYRMIAGDIWVVSRRRTLDAPDDLGHSRAHPKQRNVARRVQRAARGHGPNRVDHGQKVGQNLESWSCHGPQRTHNTRFRRSLATRCLVESALTCSFVQPESGEMCGGESADRRGRDTPDFVTCEFGRKCRLTCSFR